MAEDSDSSRLQSRLRDLESQLQEVQKRTRDLMSPGADALLDASEDPRDSMEFRETSSFPAPKDPEFPAVRERTNRATGRYDQDVGDLAQSKEIASDAGSQDYGEEPARGQETPQAPYYPTGMVPPYYPMYPPPAYYPMPQMNYMQPGIPVPQQYQSGEGSWPQRTQPQQPRPQSRSRNESRPSHAEEELKAEISRLREQFEEQLRERDEEIERLKDETENRPEESERVTALQRKVRELEDALEYSKHEMEMAKDYIEKQKSHVDDKERGLRQKLQDCEQEVKFLREKSAKLESALASERVKANSALEKVSQSEESLTIFQEKLTNTTKDLDEMKRTRLQYIQKYQSDVESLKKEVKLLTNSLEQAHVQLDQARYELMERDRRAKVNSQEQANVEVNRLTQQVHMLQRQLEDTYGKLGVAPKPTRTPQPDLPPPDRAAGKSNESDYGGRKPRALDYEATSDAPSRPPRAPTAADSEQQYEWVSAPRKPRAVDYQFESTAKGEAPESRYEWIEKPRPRAQSAARESEAESYDPVQTLENQLVSLQMEKQQLEGEFLKLPDRARTLQVKKRKEELEARLKVIDANLGSIKGQLRTLKVLHK